MYAFNYKYKTEDGYIVQTASPTEELEAVGIEGDYIYTENKQREEQDLNKRIKY